MKRGLIVVTLSFVFILGYFELQSGDSSKKIGKDHTIHLTNTFQKVKDDLFHFILKKEEKPKQDIQHVNYVSNDIRHLSLVEANHLNDMLSGKLSGYGQTFIEAGQKYNIDPAFLVAISIHETGNGSSNAIYEHNNVGGIMLKAGGLRSFSSVQESIYELARILQDVYVENERVTPTTIQEWYAPNGAKNDPNNLNKYWVNGVVHHWNKARMKAHNIVIASEERELS